MGEKTTIPVKSEKLKNIAWRLIGAAKALDKLKEAKAHDKLPGYALALALVDSVVADYHAQTAGEALREAARAGFDISKLAGVYTLIEGGKIALEAEAMDLADMGDQP